MDFLAVFVSLPAKASAGRVRVWRAAKALGCVALRDGVYLLPASPDYQTQLDDLATSAVKFGGSGEVYRISTTNTDQESDLMARFDRSQDYGRLAAAMAGLTQMLSTLDAAAATRRLHTISRRFDHLTRIDFFPGEARRQTLNLLNELRASVNRLNSSDEPAFRQAAIVRLDREAFQQRIWATRARPWVDRLASAWLILRFIDSRARIVWLSSPQDCQADWLGFDFDGAPFTHIGNCVTFETLLLSFSLEADPALKRIGDLVHCLDVGGLPIPEAPGVEALLAGLRDSEPNDDHLLKHGCTVFDWLHRSYQEKLP